MSEIVLITRYGGLGDLIMMIPTIRAIRDLHPKAKHVLRTYMDYLGYIDHLFDHVILDDNRNITFQDVRAYGKASVTVTEKNLCFADQGDTIYHYNFQGAIELRSDIHGIEAFAIAAGVDVSAYNHSLKGPGYSKIRPVVVQLRHNNDGRGLSREDLPPSFLSNPEVYIIDKPLLSQIYLSVIESAETFIGPDSSGLHLASALGVGKIIGLYTKEFPPATRAYPGVLGFTDREEFRRALERIPVPRPVP